MKKYNLINYVLLLSINALLLALISCVIYKGDKIPITTTSEEALTYYLQGRDLNQGVRS